MNINIKIDDKTGDGVIIIDGKPIGAIEGTEMKVHVYNEIIPTGVAPWREFVAGARFSVTITGKKQ